VDFDTDKTFYTETMARLLTRQGRFDRAADVYRYLLEQTPHRKELERALADVLSAIPAESARWENAGGLIERWVTLMLRCKALRRLQQMQMCRNSSNRPGL